MNFKRMTSQFVCLLSVLLAVGCGRDDQKNNVSPSNTNLRGVGDVGSDDRDGGGAGIDAELDMSTDAVDSGNAGDDTGNVTGGDPGGCGDELVSAETFDLDTGPWPGQLYARAAWDGAGVWVVYAKRISDQQGAPEEVFGVRVACDGTIAAPIQLSSGNGNRNYAPVVASNYRRTHVAWIEQPPGGGDMTVRLQVLNQEGVAVLDEPADVTPVGAEEPLSGLAWEPTIGVFNDGTGIAGLSAAGTGEFQVVLQRYDESGATGQALVPFTEKGVDQRRPSIAAAEDGTVYVSWTRYKAADEDAGTPEEPERVVFTSIPAGANMIFPATPIAAKPLAEPNPIGRYAREPGPNGEHYLAFQVTNSQQADILVRDGTDFNTANTSTMGSNGFVNFRPSVAGGTNRGALAWYRYTESPQRNQVVIQSFGADGGLTPGPEIHVETSSPAIPPYGPDVTWAGDDTYFLTWSEGDSGATARVKGRFMDLQ